MALYGIIAALVAATAALFLRGQGLQGLLNNLKSLKIDGKLDKDSIIKQAEILVTEKQQVLNEEARKAELEKAKTASEQEALDFWKKQ